MCLTFEGCSGWWGCSWWFCPLILLVVFGFTVRWSGGADIDLCDLSSASTTLGSTWLFCPKSTVFLRPYCGKVCSSWEVPASWSVCVAAVCCCGDCGCGCGDCGCWNWSSREPNLLFQCDGKCSLNSGGMSSNGNLSKPPKSLVSAIMKRFVTTPAKVNKPSVITVTICFRLISIYKIDIKFKIIKEILK